MRFHIWKKKRFNEDETRFMMGCLILGLEYMHSQSVIHRVMKPENIIMEENGYLRITDFGISKCGVRITPQTPQEPRDTLLLRSCAAKITVLLLTILQLE